MNGTLSGEKPPDELRGRVEAANGVGKANGWFPLNRERVKIQKKNQKRAAGPLPRVAPSPCHQSTPSDEPSLLSLLKK